MELQALTEFLVLADTRNFSRAALRLHMSGTALTRHIQRLESDLKTNLFDRTIPLNLTAAGRELLPKADKLVKHAERLLREMRQSQAPRQAALNIGFLPGTLHLSLTGALARFRKKNQDVRVKIQELSLPDQVSHLQNEELDVAIVGHPWPELSRDCDLFDLGSIPLCAILSTTHRLARSQFDLRDLRGEEFVALCGETCPGQTNSMVKACREAGFEPNFTATANGKSALLIMVGATHRIGLLPATAIKIPHTGADFHPLSHQVSCCAAVKRGESRSNVREFLQELQREFRKVHAFGFPSGSQSTIAHAHKKIPVTLSRSTHVA